LEAQGSELLHDRRIAMAEIRFGIEQQAAEDSG
jgi:hypothetical protein